METYAALLRAVNVAKTRVPMAALRGLLSELGYADVRSLLQSGNLVFATQRTSAAALEQRLEREAAARLGLTTDFFMRTGGELETVLLENPFADAAASDPAHLVVAFLREAPPAGAGERLQRQIVGPERAVVVGRHAYIIYPAGIGESKLTAAVIERALGTRVTARNWNTVTKLAAAVRSA